MGSSWCWKRTWPFEKKSTSFSLNKIGSEKSPEKKKASEIWRHCKTPSNTIQVAPLVFPWVFGAFNFFQLSRVSVTAGAQTQLEGSLHSLRRAGLGRMAAWPQNSTNSPVTEGDRELWRSEIRWLYSSGWWIGTSILFSHILAISSFQLTFIFFRGGCEGAKFGGFIHILGSHDWNIWIKHNKAKNFPLGNILIESPNICPTIDNIGEPLMELQYYRVFQASNSQEWQINPGRSMTGSTPHLQLKKSLSCWGKSPSFLAVFFVLEDAEQCWTHVSGERTHEPSKNRMKLRDAPQVYSNCRKAHKPLNVQLLFFL